MAAVGREAFTSVSRAESEFLIKAEVSLYTYSFLNCCGLHDFSLYSPPFSAGGNTLSQCEEISATLRDPTLCCWGSGQVLCRAQGSAQPWGRWAQCLGGEELLFLLCPS